MPMDSSSVSTFILGSDGLFREGLRLILSKTAFRPLACATELSGLPEVPDGSPVLFVVGRTDEEHDSICMKIRSAYPGAFIVVVGDLHVNLTKTLAEGANAAFLSSITPKALVTSLQALVSGDLIIVDNRLWSSSISRKPEEPSHPIRIPERSSAPIQIAAQWEAEKEAQDSNHLSVREIAILERIVKGDSNKHVARFFKIAEATVKAHVKAIFRKIGATNRTQAAMWAVQHRVFDQTEEFEAEAKL
jgi:two-component system, NarL family, nitrate/nitrite response regulator NarL